jgi:hypothetical protein
MLQLSIRSAGFLTGTEHNSLLPNTCNLPACLNIPLYPTLVMSRVERKQLGSALGLYSISNHLSLRNIAPAPCSETPSAYIQPSR